MQKAELCIAYGHLEQSEVLFDPSQSQASPRRVSTPDQTFKVLAASAGKERRSEIGTSFPSRPPSVPPSLLPFPAFTSLSLPSPTQRERHNQLFIPNKGREGGRCCQQLHGRLLRFLCKLSKRLVKKLSSPKPRASSGAPWPSPSPDPLQPPG